jgi:hypothetical protein
VSIFPIWWPYKPEDRPRLSNASRACGLGDEGITSGSEGHDCLPQNALSTRLTTLFVVQAPARPQAGGVLWRGPDMAPRGPRVLPVLTLLALALAGSVPVAPGFPSYSNLCTLLLHLTLGRSGSVHRRSG